MGEMYPSSAVAQMMEKQWHRWLLLSRREPHAEMEMPTVTISREKGSGGSSIGMQVADQLGFVLFDREIVDYVARSASVDRLAVMHLDERSRHSIQKEAELVIDRQNFSTHTYMAHLTRTILTIGEKGSAVIVGRGAHLLLPVERSLRVRVIAPLDVRIARLAAALGIKHSEAEAAIAETDRQRAQFVEENFDQSDSNPLLYDLTLNTAEIAPETAADLVVRAVTARFPQLSKLTASHVP